MHVEQIRLEIVVEAITAQVASVMKVGNGHMPANSLLLLFMRRTLQTQHSLLGFEQPGWHDVISAWNDAGPRLL